MPNWPPARKRSAAAGLGHRNWESEPLLEEESDAAAPMRRPRSRAEIASSGAAEKEKSKAMLSVESKLMKAIKEVNESDLSENSTPVNRWDWGGDFQIV